MILKNILKSCAFISVYVATFRYMLCITKNSRGKVDRWNVIMACIASSFAMLFEAKSRMREVMFYMVPRALESLYNLMVQKGMARHFMYAEVLVFALSMALIMYYYENYPENIKPAYRSILKKFFGVN